MTTTTTDDDVVLASWAEAALTQGEAALAARLLGGRDEPWARVERAHALLLTGRVDEARTLLAAHATDLPPDGTPPSWPEVLLGAARALDGDDDAHAWLVRVAARAASDAYAPDLARLVGTVAQARHDEPVAALARGVRVHRWGSTARADVVPLVATSLRTRDPATPAEQLVHLAWGSVEDLCAVDAEPAGATHLVRATAGRLDAAGDAAGATLLRRAAALRLPGDAAARLDPGRRRRVLVGAGLVLAQLGVAASAALLGPWGALVPVVTAGALAALHLRRPAGLRATERAALRLLTSVRLDPVRGCVPSASARHDVWVTALGVALGAVGTGAVLTASAAAAPFAVPPVRVTFWWVLVVHGAALGGWASSRALAAHRRRRARTAVDEAWRARRRFAGGCLCTQQPALAGAYAQAYAAEHLMPASRTVPRTWAVDEDAGPDGVERVCPETGAVWLTDLTAHDGVPLALRGRPFPDRSAPEGTGFYL